MSNNANFPQFNTPPIMVDPVTGQTKWNKEWWLFLINLFNRTGGTIGVNSSDSEVIENIDDANDLSNQVPTLIGKISQVEVDLAEILQDGQDAINKAMRALQNMIIEQATTIEVIRSMANQDADAVAITGGTIKNCAITATKTPLGIRSSGASFDLQIGSSEVLTANRTLSVILNDAARTMTVAGSTTIPIAAQSLTFTGPSAARTITLPDTNITVARTDAGQTFTGNQTIVGSNTVTTGFGCNGQAAQTTYVSGSAATAAGATYSQTQVASIVTLVNNLQAALVANGICS